MGAELQDSLGYTEKPCLKNKTKTKYHLILEETLNVLAVVWSPSSMKTTADSMTVFLRGILNTLAAEFLSCSVN